MLKFKKIFLSLCLCLILLTGSVFATTMSESEIKSTFNSSAENFTNNSQYMYFNLSEIQSTVQTYMTNEDLGTLSSNYITYVYNDDDDYFKYYDLDSATIDSISTTEYDITINFSGTVDYYGGYCMEGDVLCFEHYTSNTISMSKYITTTGNTFDTVFTYTGNNIFTDSGSSGDNTLLQDLADSVTAVLSYIPIVINGLWQIVLIQFIILASLSISLIYFVVKLLKGFTGNKLNGKKFKK